MTYITGILAEEEFYRAFQDFTAVCIDKPATLRLKPAKLKAIIAAAEELKNAMWTLKVAEFPSELDVRLKDQKLFAARGIVQKFATEFWTNPHIPDYAFELLRLPSRAEGREMLELTKKVTSLRKKKVPTRKVAISSAKKIAKPTIPFRRGAIATAKGGITPDAPFALTVSACRFGVVRLSWTKNGEPPRTKFIIERRDSPISDWTFAGISYRHCFSTDWPAGKYVEYRVRTEVDFIQGTPCAPAGLWMDQPKERVPVAA